MSSEPVVSTYRLTVVDGHLVGAIICEFCYAIILADKEDAHAQWHVDSDKRDLRLTR